MKKTLVIILLAIVTFSSCQKDDEPLFDKSPDERLNEALAGYQSQLTSATDGWKGFIYPRSGGVYSFYFKFNDANRVNMLSSFDSVSAVTLKESSYRLKALQQPSLLFDTYSYLHVLADPNPEVNGGTDNAGLRSDFEFLFDSSSADTINLIGRFNGSRATLIKATPEEAAGFTNGQLASGFLLNKLQTFFKRVTIGSQKFDFNINPLTRTLSMVDATGNLLDTSLTTGYYMTFSGIGFIKPLVAGNQTISGISNIIYNQTSQTISCTVNNTAATVSNVIVPLKVDVNAPGRWWNARANGNYWVSVSGFHVNGVDDAFQLNSLTANASTYYFLIYYPKFFAGGEDLFAPVFLNAAQDSLKLEYGGASRQPAYTFDGRGVFTQLGTLRTIPSTGAGASTIRQFYNPRGYYFVQTSETSYSMVSASDGKSWISWQ